MVVFYYINIVNVFVKNINLSLDIVNIFCYNWKNQCTGNSRVRRNR